MTVALADEPIAFVDVETTGGHPAWHRLTEIAIIGMTGGRIDWEWSRLVNPGVRIPPSIERLTGISNALVAEAPPFEAIATEVLERLEGRRFVAHNARFDYGFVRTELRRAGYAFRASLACTVRLSRELYPEAGRHNLDALIARHGLVCPTRHRALPDAAVLAQFWLALRDAWPTDVLDAAIERVGRRPSLPPHLPADLVDDLPESSGVYRFHGEGDALIYVGKAKQLRERVLAHFLAADRDTKSQRLASQVRRIEWTETAGELGAWLLEARLVRESKPVYNRRLRGEGETWTWQFGDAPQAPILSRLEGPIPNGVDSFGLYRSERAARTALTTLAREAKLCLKCLGLEAAGAGSCFAHQLGRCAGACVGAEPLARHHLRAKLAMASLKLRTWPYPGAVAVEETSSQGVRQWHIIEGWQYLGTVDDSERSATPSIARVRTDRFDADVYRLLCRYLTPTRRGIRAWPMS